MNTHELVVTVRVYEDIHLHDVNEQISKLLKKAYEPSEFLTNFHQSRETKHSSFSNLSPFETNTKIYKRGKTYTFKVRSTSGDFITLLHRHLEHTKTDNLLVLGCFYKMYRNRLTIDELRLVTPVVLKDKDGDFHIKGVIDFIERLTNSSNSKYSKYKGERTSIDFIESVNLNSGVPGINYKDLKYYGKTGKIKVKRTPEAQEMAYYLISAGMGVSTLGLGLGFVNPVFLENLVETEVSR